MAGQRRRRTGRFTLTVPGVARYWVEGGERILVQPDGGSEAAIQQFMGTTPLAALFYQRGLLGLHAAAMALPAAGLLPQGAILLARSLWRGQIQPAGWTDVARGDCFV